MIEAWINYHRDRVFPEELFWAVEELSDLERRAAPSETWEVIVELVASAPDDWVLANIAAGPLEDLIRKYPYFAIDLIETHAKRNIKFRRCQTGVWLGKDFPEGNSGTSPELI